MAGTRNDRSSAIHVALPFRGQWPRVEGLPDAKDRAQSVHLYRGVVAQEFDITSTQVLHKPVDYVLAGQQHSFKPGRASGRALSHAFGE